MPGFFRNLIDRWPASRARAAPTIEIADDAVVIRRQGHPSVRFRWAEVDEAVTFKRDCYIYDDIRLAFRLADRWVEISEESPEWSDLAAAMESHLPGVPADWYLEVMMPAFATNFRVLFRKA